MALKIKLFPIDLPGFFLSSFADGAKQSAVTFFVLFFYYFSFYFFLEGDQVTRKKITEVASRREKEKEKETEKKTEPPKTFEDLRKFLKKKKIKNKKKREKEKKSGKAPRKGDTFFTNQKTPGSVGFFLFFFFLKYF